MRQYLACTFRLGDGRPYTYHNDGDPLAPGQTARVETSRGEGWQLVYVSAIVPEVPEGVDTKPILAPDWVDRLTLAQAVDAAAQIARGPHNCSPNEVARIEKKASKYVPRESVAVIEDDDPLGLGLPPAEGAS